MLKTCPTCKKEFKIYRSPQIYCSRACYHKTGSMNPKWKGGVLLSGGYRYIYSPDHPNATQMGYVCEHRLVMEQELDRYLEKHEIVHHINQDRSDNRLENLMLYTSYGKHATDNHVVRNAQGQFAPLGSSTERPRYLTDIDWLYEQYITHNRTAKDIASELDVSHQAIASTIHRHRITKRKPYSNQNAN